MMFDYASSIKSHVFGKTQHKLGAGPAEPLRAGTGPPSQCIYIYIIYIYIIFVPKSNLVNKSQIVCYRMCAY